MGFLGPISKEFHLFFHFIKISLDILFKTRQLVLRLRHERGLGRYRGTPETLRARHVQEKNWQNT